MKLQCIFVVVVVVVYFSTALCLLLIVENVLGLVTIWMCNDENRFEHIYKQFHSKFDDMDMIMIMIIVTIGTLFWMNDIGISNRSTCSFDVMAIQHIVLLSWCLPVPVLLCMKWCKNSAFIRNFNANEKRSTKKRNRCNRLKWISFQSIRKLSIILKWYLCIEFICVQAVELSVGEWLFLKLV